MNTRPRSHATGNIRERPNYDLDEEAIYDDMSAPIGMLKFAPPVDAQGSMFSARRRMEARGVTLAGEEPAAVIREGGVS